MKKIITTVLISAMLMSCSSLMKKDVRAFIEGTYLRPFESEFAVGVDSVVLEHRDGDHYLITKYSRFSRLKNGERGKEEFIEEKMAGVYDPHTEMIHEVKKGKVLHFDPDKNKMLIGATEYTKVK